MFWESGVEDLQNPDFGGKTEFLGGPQKRPFFRVPGSPSQKGVKTGFLRVFQVFEGFSRF